MKSRRSADATADLRSATADQAGSAGRSNAFMAGQLGAVAASSGRLIKLCVVITHGKAGSIPFADHAALVVDAPGVEDDTLYDPGGSYKAGKKGHGDMLIGEEADLKDFIDYHDEAEDGKVEVFTFTITDEEMEIIVRKMESEGGRKGGYCTQGVISVLAVLDRFKNLKPTFWPGTLAEQIKKYKPDITMHNNKGNNAGE